MAGNWAKQSNITGPHGSVWYAGADYPAASMPDPAGRTEGDMYLKTVDPDGGTVWRWTFLTNNWVYTGSDLTGPQGPTGIVAEVMPGTNIAVDSSDPAHPVVSAPGVATTADLAAETAARIADVDAEEAARIAADNTLQTNINGKVAKAGDTMTGPLVLPGAPTTGLQAATKDYVDSKTFDLHGLPLKAAPDLADEAVLANSVGGVWTLVKTTVQGLASTALATIGTFLHALGQKATLVDADEFMIADSAAAWLQKRHSWANLQTMVGITDNLLGQRLAAQQTNFAGDINTLVGAGWYYCSIGSTNGPVPGTGGHLLVLNQQTSATISRQIWFHSNGYTIYHRWRHNAVGSGAWQSWAELPSVIAATSEYLANTAGRVPSVNTLWAAAVPVVLTYAASLAANFSTFIDSECALTGNCTLTATTVKNGQKGIMWFTASGADRTLTLSTGFGLLKDVEVGPYLIANGALLGIAYATRGGAVNVTSILRWP